MDNPESISELIFTVLLTEKLSTHGCLNSRQTAGAEGGTCEPGSPLVFVKVLVGASVELLEAPRLTFLWERWGN